MKAHVYDTANFLSTLSPKKALNFYHVWTSFRESRSSKHPAIKGMPVSLSIEPTTACNLRCPECPSGLRSFTRPTGKLNQPLFQKAIDELYPWLMNLTFYFQGEPYLNPDFLDMVTYANQHQIYTMTSTNAHFLDEITAKKTIQSGLKRLIISIDGLTQETYSDYRKSGELEKVLNGTREIIQWKKAYRSMTPHVVWQFLVTGKNEHEIPSLKRLAKSYGVDEVKLKTIQVYDYEHGSPLIPSNNKYSRYYKTKEGKYAIKNNLENNCWKMWHSAVITWEGKVLPCCFDKDGQYVLGNLNNQTFRELWTGTDYNKFREKLFISRSEIEICKNCSEGSPVWV